MMDEFGSSDDSLVANSPSKSTTNRWTSFSNRLATSLNFSSSWSSSASFKGGRGDHSINPVSQIDLLRINPEDVATQLTLIDFPIFKSIDESELTSIAWNTSKKMSLAPNIVKLTKRFNQISFWVVEEILQFTSNSLVASNNVMKRNLFKTMHRNNSSSSLSLASSIEIDAKCRSEKVIFFIKVAEKLVKSTSNLHSSYAIVCALNSSPIYRLSKTWSYVPKKEKLILQRLQSLFSEESNFQNLRCHLDSIIASKNSDYPVPCIPYLGMYLRDLVYVDDALPSPAISNEARARSSNGKPISGQKILRDPKMANILSAIRHFQDNSTFYESLQVIPHIKEYLMSARYIEELQKFLEEDNYKLSLKLEPPSVTNIAAVEVPKVKNKSKFYIDDYTTSRRLSGMSSSCSNSMPDGYQTRAPFKPGHRKARSLGSGILLDTVIDPSELDLDRRISVDPSTKVKAGVTVSSVRDPDWIVVDNITNNLIDDSLTDDTDLKSKSTLERKASLDVNGFVNGGFLSSPSKSKSKSHKFYIEMDDALDDGPVVTEPQLLLEQSRRNRKLAASSSPTPTFEGSVKRKTISKDGKRPAIPVWIKYWLELKGSLLIYYPSKSLKGFSKSSFRTSHHCKKICLLGGWSVTTIDHTNKQFILSDPHRLNVYKFEVSCEKDFNLWIRHLSQLPKVAGDEINSPREVKSPTPGLTSFKS